jgi:hypothetical protein
MMKLLSYALLFSSFVGTAFCQSAVIGLPADGTTVSPGSTITVEVDRPVRHLPLI